jgi:Zn-dependent M28 family amino/carboxypeptidase
MKRNIILAASAVALFASAGVGLVWGAVGTNSKPLRDAVTVAGVRAHQAALQAIADANGNTRASGTPGYAASAAYVKNKLEAAGYAVTLQPFDFPFFEEVTPATFAQTAPDAVSYGYDTDFATLTYSASTGPAGVTGLVQQVNDNVFPPAATPSSTAGCEAADFNGFVPGSIALIQRGTCTFAQKVANAAAAGAKAVIIFNEGNPGRTDLFFGTLFQPSAIPAISVSFGLGSTLASTAGLQVHITTNTISETRSTVNVIAETPKGRSDRVVVVGAHLDSVAAGPGINDNGSGTASNLEIALQMAKLGIKPVNKVRFAFWGAEEEGLQGSAYYVSQLSKRDIKNIAVNLNFDMIGSPNFARFVYDGDGSDTGTAGPNGSATIERIFNSYFAKQGLAVEATAFDGRSDYGPFIDVGIPAGGLFTGAEGIKTPEQAALFGGTAGEAFDHCYHQACDTYANNNDTAIDQMSDAAADAVLQFAMTTSSVKGTSRANDRAVSRVQATSLAYRGDHLQK